LLSLITNLSRNDISIKLMKDVFGRMGSFTRPNASLPYQERIGHHLVEDLKVHKMKHNEKNTTFTVLPQSLREVPRLAGVETPRPLGSSSSENLATICSTILKIFELGLGI